MEGSAVGDVLPYRVFRNDASAGSVLQPCSAINPVEYAVG